MNKNHLRHQCFSVRPLCSFFTSIPIITMMVGPEGGVRWAPCSSNPRRSEGRPASNSHLSLGNDLELSNNSLLRAAHSLGHLPSKFPSSSSSLFLPSLLPIMPSIQLVGHLIPLDIDSAPERGTERPAGSHHRRQIVCPLSLLSLHSVIQQHAMYQRIIFGKPSSLGCFQIESY